MRTDLVRGPGWLAYLPSVLALLGLMLIAVLFAATGAPVDRFDFYTLLVLFGLWTLLCALQTFEARRWYQRANAYRTARPGKASFDRMLVYYREQLVMMAIEHADMAEEVRERGEAYADRLRMRSWGPDLFLAGFVLEGLWLLQQLESGSDDPVEDVQLTLTAAALELSRLDRELAS